MRTKLQNAVAGFADKTGAVARFGVMVAGLCASLLAPAGAAVVGSSNINHTFVPSSELYGYSDPFYLPGISELRFSSFTALVNTSGEAAVINANFQPLGVWGPQGFTPLALMVFTTKDSMEYWGPNYVGPGGWEPSSGLETNALGFEPGLLAFSVDRDDGRHYGWVEFISTPTTFTLLQYGYQTTPGTSIRFYDTGGTVPEPSSFALVALGLLAAGSWGKRQKSRRAFVQE